MVVNPVKVILGSGQEEILEKTADLLSFGVGWVGGESVTSQGWGGLVGWVKSVTSQGQGGLLGRWRVLLRVRRPGSGHDSLSSLKQVIQVSFLSSGSFIQEIGIADKMVSSVSLNDPP